VAHQYGVPSPQLKDEPLVSRPFDVIPEHPRDLSTNLDHHPGALVAEKLFDVTLCRDIFNLVQRYPDIEQSKQNQEKSRQELFLPSNHETPIETALLRVVTRKATGSLSLLAQ